MSTHPVPILGAVQALRRLVDLWESGAVVARQNKESAAVWEAYMQAKALLAEIGREAENSPPLSR